MRTNRTLLVVLAVISAIFMLLLSLLVNLATTYVADPLKPYATWIFIALGVVFVASLGVLVWQMRAERQHMLEADALKTPEIAQSAKSGGQILDSPNRIAGQVNATIGQTAEDHGRIEGSGNTIE